MFRIFLEVLRWMALKSAGWFLTNTVMSMATGSYLSMLKKEGKNIKVKYYEKQKRKSQMLYRVAQKNGTAYFPQHFTRVCFWCKECTLIKLIGFNTQNCGKLKWHSFTSCLSWKRDTFGAWHCLTKCALENKLLNQNCWSWYHFSQKLPHTLIPVIASTYCGKYMLYHFFWGHPV